MLALLLALPKEDGEEGLFCAPLRLLHDLRCHEAGRATEGVARQVLLRRPGALEVPAAAAAAASTGAAGALCAATCMGSLTCAEARASCNNRRVPGTSVPPRHSGSACRRCSFRSWHCWGSLQTTETFATLCLHAWGRQC